MAGVRVVEFQDRLIDLDLRIGKHLVIGLYPRVPDAVLGEDALPTAPRSFFCMCCATRRVDLFALVELIFFGEARELRILEGGRERRTVREREREPAVGGFEHAIGRLMEARRDFRCRCGGYSFAPLR